MSTLLLLLSKLRTAGGGGSSVSITSGTFANLPGTPSSGDLYIFEDSVYEFALYDGAAWKYFREGLKATPPVDADFAWVNQGAASVATTKGGIYLTGPAVNNANLRIRKKALTNPKTYTMGCLVAQPGGNVLTTTGMILRESATSKLLICGHLGTGSLVVYTYATETSAATNVVTYAAGSSLTGVVWFRIVVDATNKTFYFSRNGLHFHQFYQATIGTSFTTAPDEIGFFVNPHNAVYETGMHVFSWQES